MPLELKGTAVLTYLMFIKAYAGALYLPDEVEGKHALTDVPRCLTLEYRVAIKAEDFATATSESILKSEGSEAYRVLEPDINRLNRLYRDVRPGDRYALTYMPDNGTELSLNGQPLGKITGRDFSRAVFSIWLGPTPIDKRFRDQLTGGKP